MSKRSKSKRFVQQGSDSVKKHSERFPYRKTLSDNEAEIQAEMIDLTSRGGA